MAGRDERRGEEREQSFARMFGAEKLHWFVVEVEDGAERAGWFTERRRGLSPCVNGAVPKTRGSW